MQVMQDISCQVQFAPYPFDIYYIFNWLYYSQTSSVYRTLAREGVIIECPLNWQNHDRRDVILTSRMAVSNNFITVTVIQNIENSSKHLAKNNIKTE